MGALRLCILALFVSYCCGVSVSAADTAALLLPMAVQFGCGDLVSMAQSLAVVGQEAAALALLAYARVRIMENQDTHSARHAAGADDRHGRQATFRCKRTLKKNRKLKHIDWQAAVMDHMTPAEFRNAYGLSHELFASLLALIHDDITVPACMSTRQ